MRLGLETEAERMIVPWNPRLFRLIVDDFEPPDAIVRLVGFAEIVKPLVMVKVRPSFLVMPPPVPVTVSV